MPLNDSKPLPALSQKDIQRFWSKVAILGPDECWLWLASCDVRGYGRFHPTRTTIARSHRVAYELTHGPLAPGKYACHSCDIRYALRDYTNRRCCNPAHLFEGTAKMNHDDMVAKQRKNGLKLNSHSVLEIRERARNGESYDSIARSFGVLPGTIYGVATHRSWKHATASPASAGPLDQRPESAAVPEGRQDPH